METPQVGQEYDPRQAPEVTRLWVRRSGGKLLAVLDFLHKMSDAEVDALRRAFDPIYGELCYYVSRNEWDEWAGNPLVFETEEQILSRIPETPLPGCSGVYLIARQDGLVKIGYTKQMRTRLRQLRREHGENLRLIHFIYCDGRRTDAELDLHKRFARKHRGGEWFELTDYDLKWLFSLLHWPEVKR